jgi:hypothetical protein
MVHFTTSAYVWISVTPLTTFGQHNLEVWYIKAIDVIPIPLFGRFNDRMCKKDNRVSIYTVDLKHIDLPMFNTMFEDMAAFWTKYPQTTGSTERPSACNRSGGFHHMWLQRPHGQILPSLPSLLAMDRR